MKINYRDDLLFVTAVVQNSGRSIQLENVILDTGSAGTVFDADKMAEIGLTPRQQDILYRIRGVGGEEYVYTRRIERLAIGERILHDFDIEIGALDYGFELDGMIGLDFLTQAGAVIDLVAMELRGGQ